MTKPDVSFTATVSVPSDLTPAVFISTGATPLKVKAGKNKDFCSDYDSGSGITFHEVGKDASSKGTAKSREK